MGSFDNSEKSSEIIKKCFSIVFSTISHKVLHLKSDRRHFRNNFKILHKTDRWSCYRSFQYTSCILRETGGLLAALCCSRIPSMSGHMSVYSAYTGKIKGYTERGVDGMCTDLIYLVDNGPGFYLQWNLFSEFLVAGFMVIQTLALKLIRKQTPFTCVPLYSDRGSKASFLPTFQFF